MPYPDLLVQPMREQLTLSGVEELRTAEDVEAFFKRPGTALLVFNSVCGCAAGSARPAVIAALEDESRPDHAVTVFAGQDAEATDCARRQMPQLPPSSPSFVVLRDGQPVAHFARDRIEGRSAEVVASMLVQAFGEL